MRTFMKPVALLALFMVIIGSSIVHAAWVDNGVPLCAALGAQDLPVAVSDGLGGVIIAWRDDRTVNGDIYAQRIDADGNILWIDTGMPVCTAINYQSNPQIISDGAGGAIIAWNDARSGSTNDIYAQRLDAMGFIQWPPNGVAICTGQLNLLMGQMISDGLGGAIIAWHDRRNFTNDIFAQRVDAWGGVQWTANGVPICTAVEHQEYPTLASDGANGAIIAWEDRRHIGSTSLDIWAQRVDASGNIMWTADGVVVADLFDVQRTAQAVSDGAGGAIVAWEDRRNTMFFGIFAQRMSPGGVRLWPTGSIQISSWTLDQWKCRLTPVYDGKVIIMWEDERNGTDNFDIYAQQIDTTGTVSWTASGIAVCNASGHQIELQIIPNGYGGAIATWEDERNGTSSVDIYAQRVDGTGLPMWTADGVIVCNATGNQSVPSIAPDGWGGAHITWTDPRGGTPKVYDQRVDGAGNTVVATLLQRFSAAWSEPGVRIDWTLSEAGEGIEFLVSRAAEPSTIFSEIISDGIKNDGRSYWFVDGGCIPGKTYYYRVDVLEGGEQWLLFETGPVETPAMALTLYQNSPNPFNPSTTIRYHVPERCMVTLDVYGVSGDHVARLYEGFREPGTFSAAWNGCDGKGIQMSSGVYLYRLRAGKEILSRKMILLR